MGLRPDGAKPARVLRLVYILGWLPALVGALLTHGAAGPNDVLSRAGSAAVPAALGLGLSLAVLSGAYFTAIRRPPSQSTLIAACVGSLLVALALPVLFSADVYAYAYYGDLALHGRNPWTHGPAPHPDALAAAAVRAWDGRVPPRCVYGPLAVAIAALANGAGAAAGVNAQITAGRLVAGAAYLLFLFFSLRLVQEPRTRVVLLLNPVVIWSVAEGHNDAAMVALACAGVTAHRPLVIALAALVKAPALLVLGTLGRSRSRAAALALAVAGYMPLAITVATTLPDPAAGAPAAWQSPLGMLAALVGRLPAMAIALLALFTTAAGVRRFPAADRWAALALAAWFALPNAYPWYALWIVPLAAWRTDSLWSRTLLVASLSAPARAISDAVFPAPSTFDAAHTFNGRMIALEFLPPLCFFALAALRGRRAVISTTVAATLVFCGLPAGAQTGTPLPRPPDPAASVQAPEPTAQPAVPLPTPAPPAAPLATAPLATAPPATPTPAAPAGATAGTVPLATPVPTPSAAGTPTPVPNPFTYVITPAPVPVTTPDGPHIIQVLINDRQIHAGGPLIVRVLTSANVVGVEARALGRFIPIPENGPGLFALTYTMPGGIPFWLLNRNYDIVIAAATADGRQVSVSFPMLLMR